MGSKLNRAGAACPGERRIDLAYQSALVACLVVAMAHGLVGCRTTSSSTDDGVTQASSSASAQAAQIWSVQDHNARDLVPVSRDFEDVILRGGTLLTVTGDRIEGGDLWLRDGKIEGVYASPLEAIPDGVTVLDVSGKFITPGLIDSHSHLGVYASPSVPAHSDGNEATSPATPDVEAIHSVWPQDPGFQRALAGGITSLQILPGSANLIGGRAATLQLHPGISAEAMRFPGAPVGVKMACGENPKRVYGSRGGKPSTRMGNMAVWRSLFIAAAEEKEKYERHEKSVAEWLEKEDRKESDRPRRPGRDLAKQTLVGILRGDVLVHVHCYRADEMIQVLQLADEFGFRVRSFHHAVEAYKIRDILAKWDVSVSTWADWWGFKIEAHDAILQNAGLLDEAGVRAIIHSDSEYDIQRLNQEASKAYYSALYKGVEVTEEDALRWITINPAWALGIDDVTGSLEQGKRADVVVWSAHPLSVYAEAEKVYVEGVLEFDRGDPSTLEPWSDYELGATPRSFPISPSDALEEGSRGSNTEKKDEEVLR